MLKTVAIILARGGSKEVPRKNIRPLAGKPLIAYTIEAAKKAEIDQVWVSTDCQEIKSISIKSGAFVIDRPPELAQDHSPSEDALLHFAENVNFETMVFIQPTSPLLSHVFINKGLSLMSEYDSVFSAYKEHWLPRWSMENEPINFIYGKRPRRQDKKEVYVENGAFYITKKGNLLSSRDRTSGNIGIVEMPFYDSFQIDTMDDFTLMEKLL
jgi:CMP-N,N'-diacetyllegionaminic acid synthase